MAQLPGSEEMIKLAASSGVEINNAVAGKTPLEISCEFGYLNLLKSLVECGANVNAASRIFNF